MEHFKYDGEDYFKLPRMAKEYKEAIGRKIHKALRLRNKARYDPHADITEEDSSLILSLIIELTNLLK